MRERTDSVSTLSDDVRFFLQCLNRSLFTTTMLRRRAFDGHIVSMQQSGTHWVKYMLSLTLASIHGLPEPVNIQDGSIVGHPKRPPVYPGIPKIVHSHSTPHFAMYSRAFLNSFHFPKYLMLVRDLREVLKAHYAKWRADYGVDFSTFLRGDPWRRRYATDIWTQVRFLNAWGPMLRIHGPSRVMVVRYEDMVKDTAANLEKICTYFGIEGMTPEIIDYVVANSTKEAMAARHDPDVKQKAVRVDSDKTNPAFSDEDTAFFQDLCRRHLKYDFGYDYGL